MPTYEYACRDCGEHLEVVQSFTDAPLTVCGACGGALRKVFSAAGIIFKGSGYYVTDSRGKKSAATAPAGGGKSGAGSGSDGGSDTGSSAGEKTGGSDAATSSSGTSSSEAKSA